MQHYLLDFGDSLGASGTEPKYLAEGYESLVDLEALTVGFFSFGIHYRYWLPVRRSPHRSVGTLESEVFDPSRWEPSIPNPAFLEADPRDLAWAGSVISRLDPELVAAAVDTAQYSDPAAREWVLRVLLERQIKVLEWTFGNFLPIDEPRVKGTVLDVTDAAVRGDVLDEEDVEYHVTVHAAGDPRAVLTDVTVRRPSVDLAAALTAARAARSFRRTLSHRAMDEMASAPRVVPTLGGHAANLDRRDRPGRSRARLETLIERGAGIVRLSSGSRSRRFRLDVLAPASIPSFR
ncbi:MAG: hypothetical protein HC923_02570 [Myxococcales bacterium]|nr:hypothetical protein [Myxococcales bacterium]